MATSSLPSVSTCRPRLPITMAVPVSWHIGSTPPAATLALRSRSRATNRSLGEAAGSSTIARSCARCAGRRKWAMSCIASAVSAVSASGATVRKLRPPGPRTTSMPSSVTSRYSVVSAPWGNIGVYENSGAVMAASLLRLHGRPRITAGGAPHRCRTARTPATARPDQPVRRVEHLGAGRLESRMSPESLSHTYTGWGHGPRPPHHRSDDHFGVRLGPFPPGSVPAQRHAGERLCSCGITAARA